MTRRYVMRARSESTARTRDRILDAVIALSEERLSVEIVLADVADRAEVSIQTILRHFGSREGLIEQAWERQVAEAQVARATPVGDVDAAVGIVVRFYERWGDWSVRLQALEHSHELSRQATEIGRRFHRNWVQQVFAPQLVGRRDRAELVDLLIIATDVLTWKILRRDEGLDQRTTCRRMTRLVHAVIGTPGA